MIAGKGLGAVMGTSTGGDSLWPLRWLMAAFAFLFLAVSSVPVLADDGGPYFQYRATAFGGPFIPQTVSFAGSGLLSGLPFTATGKLSSDIGWATGGGIGVSFEDVPEWRWLNIDLTAGYVMSTFDHFSGSISIPGLGSITGPAPLSGDYHVYAGFVNFLATPFGIRHLLDNQLTPYIGIGPGIASTTAKLQSLQLGPSTLPVNMTSNETDFAFDFAVGTDYALSEQWDLGIAYQYTWIDTKHLGTSASITANSGASSGHTIGLLLEYRFGRISE